jgi:hypothetical protein
MKMLKNNLALSFLFLGALTFAQPIPGTLN